MPLDGPIVPMVCSPGRALRAGDGYLPEPKWDGIRAIAPLTESGQRLFTRDGRGHNRRVRRINVAPAPVTDGWEGTVAERTTGRCGCGHRGKRLGEGAAPIRGGRPRRSRASERGGPDA